MSAYMVGKEHIDALCWVAYKGPLGSGTSWSPPYLGDEKIDFAHLSKLGELLVKENLSSIHSRYPDTLTNPQDTPGPDEQYWLTEYVFTKPDHQLTALQALKAIKCYEYQSCEHNEWDTSEAYKFCTGLKDWLISHLPGYDDAEWEVSNASRV